MQESYAKYILLLSRYCSSENAICHAGSTLPYDTLEMLRLRWALIHLTAPVDFEPQKCCWSNCPSTESFSHFAEFLSHFFKCEYANNTEYLCLLSLERAWYDNRCAWLTGSMRLPENEVQNMSGLTWPSEYQNFRRKQTVPLEPYEKWTKIETGNATIDAVRYGVSLTYQGWAGKSISLTGSRGCSWCEK